MTTMSTTKRQNVRLARTWPWLCTIPLRRLLLRTRRSCCLLRPTRRPPVAARVLLAWVVGRKSSSPLYVVCPPTRRDFGTERVFIPQPTWGATCSVVSSSSSPMKQTTRRPGAPSQSSPRRCTQGDPTRTSLRQTPHSSALD